ncbi:MAG: hypothetical protein AB1342_10510 [Pseudomonadota bacterium]
MEQKSDAKLELPLRLTPPRSEQPFDAGDALKRSRAEDDFWHFVSAGCGDGEKNAIATEPQLDD